MPTAGVIEAVDVLEVGGLGLAERFPGPAPDQRDLYGLEDVEEADADAQFVQLIGHAWPAVAAQAQTMLIADMRQEHHVAPLPMRWGPVLPGIEPAFRHPHQTAQMAAGQAAAILGNILKLHGF